MHSKTAEVQKEEKKKRIVDQQRELKKEDQKSIYTYSPHPHTHINTQKWGDVLFCSCYVCDSDKVFLADL